MSSKSELAAVYSSLILYDDKVDITSDKITTLCKGANIDIEIFWADIMAKTLAGKDIGALLSSVGTVTAASASTGGNDKQEKTADKDEGKDDKGGDDDGSGSEDDMGFGLFDDDD
ncbi:Ribosomal protein P1 [Oopsacas minuta]|uniref:Large ribosomal subunit protein P1 n=1 Tax=Oopsacas minuta TaxID=111878 RepID=A0AAV7JJ82_9METZ|nr:Ribosomal protein P1 [Oopsacas minuta]